MVCLDYFLTVSCEKKTLILKIIIINIFFKKIFDWPESGIRILLTIKVIKQNGSRIRNPH